ncbi:MAG TPA: hypothetical protein PKV73_01130 [Agriterribacter sp.]|nr:hypothetical protein [Agriterribacter sp.]
MALGYPSNDTQAFNSQYQITKDLSGWDKCVIQTVGPVGGQINVLGSNDGGGSDYESGNAQLAINFVPIQVTNLASGAVSGAIYGPGLFKVDVNAQYLRLQGVPASAGTNIYRLLMFNSKIS